MTKLLEGKEIESLSEPGSAEVPPPDIVAYNELRSCADLYRMHTQGILDIHPEFQRDVVWLGPMQTRFIDSLVKQLPIPSMCFAYDYKKQKWMVIDGLQRMSTIVKFLKGGDWKLSILEDIDQKLSGVSVALIKDKDSKFNEYYTRVENLSIPLTVLRCDFSKKSHLDFLFTIFHRLNSGGMKLNNQEIRNCIFGGKLNNLFKELDLLPTWRKIHKMKEKESYRFTKQELMLRFFAFHEKHTSYTGHLAKFLNDYMEDNRDPDDGTISIKRELFTKTVKLVYEGIYLKRPHVKMSLTVMESVIVGVGKNISSLETSGPDVLYNRYQTLISRDEFSEKSLIEGLSKRQRVIDRLNIAINVIGGLDP